MTNLELIIEQIKSEVSVDALGKGKFTIRGAARLLGVDEKALRKHFLSADFSPSELAQRLASHGFDVRTFSIDGIPDLAFALIAEYYAFDTGKRCTQLAKLVYRAFAAKGIRHWAREITGWQAEEACSFPAQIIQELPRKWELHYDANWQREATRITGYRWACDLRMANFISKSVYKLLPKDVYQRLMAVNSERKHAHHQFFTQKGDEVVLKQHIQRVYGLMLASQSQAQFWALMRNAFGDGIQIELELFGATEDLRRLDAA